MQTLVVTIEKSENKASWQISPVALSCRRKCLSFFQHLAFRKSGCPNDCFNQDTPHDFKYRGRFSLFFENYS